VIVSKESHAVWHETGASGANAGVQFSAIGAKGLFSPDEFSAAIKPRGHVIYPPTTLVEIENTHNRAGGVVFPQSAAEEICSIAREREIASFLDGARLWNAAVASGCSVADLAEPFDLVSVALSKGLAAPGGSVLAGSKELIGRCHRHRRMLGGAMRQAGIMAAAGLYALENNYNRLAEDHANAKQVAERLATHDAFVIDPEKVETNILVYDLAESAPDAVEFVRLAGERGVLIFPVGPRTVRAVTHCDVSHDECVRAAEIFIEIVGD
jgi:threonine aldolase